MWNDDYNRIEAVTFDQMLWKINKYVRMQYILIIRNHFKAEYHYIKINEFHDTKLIDLFMNINKPKKNWIEFRENLNAIATLIPTLITFLTLSALHLIVVINKWRNTPNHYSLRNNQCSTTCHDTFKVSTVRSNDILQNRTD